MGGKYLTVVKGMKTKRESDQHKSRRNSLFLSFLFHSMVGLQQHECILFLSCSKKSLQPFNTETK